MMTLLLLCWFAVGTLRHRLFGIRSYRSLAAWQTAHAVATGVLKLTSGRRSPESWALFDQLRRAAISVEANLVECLLGMAVEAGLVKLDGNSPLQRDVDAVVGLLRGLLKSSKTRGA